MTAIATVTQGDWEYIDEWIQHHLDIGVDLILIAYNGKAKDFCRLPKYDKVRYFDFSYDEKVPASIYHSRQARDCFSKWSDEGTSIYDMAYQQKVYNILYDIIRYTYTHIKYLTFIDVDEFIMVNNKGFHNDINELFNLVFPDVNSSFFMPMVFYHDNELIYNDHRPCIERFYNLDNFDSSYIKDDHYGFKKIVINLYHNDIKNNKCPMISPHHCALSNADFTFAVGYVELAHFYTKTIEEWIAKMNPDNDGDYFQRFKGNIVHEFFRNGNLMTDDKLRAIPKFLVKYNIDYKPEIEEINEETREKYKIANNIS